MLVERASDVTSMVAMDDWLKSAMADNTLVADLLLRLKYSSKPLSVSLFSHWGSKQPRSSASRCDARNRKKDEGCSTRFSPTTPLSWSCSGSLSAATADGCEESSRRTRSKAAASGEGNSASTQKCKRKKTFAELNQEESSLIKERVHLTKEIENKKATFEAQRASNESLKRRKLDFGSISHDKPNSSADEHLSTLPRIVPSTSRALPDANEDDTHPQAAARTEIPDLNMMPSEEEDDDSYAYIPYGMS